MRDTHATMSGPQAPVGSGATYTARQVTEALGRCWLARLAGLERIDYEAVWMAHDALDLLLDTKHAMSAA